MIKERVTAGGNLPVHVLLASPDLLVIREEELLISFNFWLQLVFLEITELFIENIGVFQVESIKLDATVGISLGSPLLLVKGFLFYRQPREVSDRRAKKGHPLPLIHLGVLFLPGLMPPGGYAALKARI
ncbi:uncharacterized protein LOC143181446 [Calliopsis andreniformis]|uniref:uncharacterized protein LOC143181446 n=1 Tax=Calliopsis andreniformis TaxID=337506 RepID=UPI003FCECAE8